MPEFKGKVALITGAVRGIGLGIAKAFAQDGMSLAVGYRNEEHLDAAMHCLRRFDGIEVHPVRLDVTDRESVSQAAREVQRVFGRLHVICNNAGVSLMGRTDAATFDDWDWILGVNLHGVINVLVTFLPLLRSHGDGGHIVNVASMSSFITGPMAGVYSTSKFAVRGLTEALRYNLATEGIGASLACPGLTRTEIYLSPMRRPPALANSATTLDETFLKRMREIHEIGMDPDEVGHAILQGMKRRDFYIFTHPEFRDELQEICAEILDAAQSDQSADPRRLAFENIRRRLKVEAMRAVDRLRGQPVAGQPI